jgi:hypothetical protein
MSRRPRLHESINQLIDDKRHAGARQWAVADMVAAEMGGGRTRVSARRRRRAETTTKAS